VAAYVALDWTKIDYMARTHGYFFKKFCQLSDDYVFNIFKKRKKFAVSFNLLF
jgi:hypothetical protein